MTTSDTSEKGLEALIVESLVNEAGCQEGKSEDYDRDHAVDLAKLTAYLKATQPKAAQALALDQEGPKRTQFLHRLQGEIAKRGIIDVLRHGVKHGPVSLDLFYGTPTPGNVKAAERYAAQISSASSGNCATARTRPNWPWICVSSSTACRWPPLS